MKKITQNLRWLVTLLTMIVSVGAWAQEVTYDFTGTGWSVSNGTLSNGTVSFTGEGGANFKMNGGYFMMGKSGAYINFPTYDFAVEKIEVVGRSGASTGVKQNIFVGDDAVSTETEGATSTNTYEIASAYQAAGTQYTLKVTSSHNTQITAIKIYKASSIAAPTFSPAGGVYSGSQTVTISCETQGVSIYYTTDGSDPDALANPYSAPITISETTTLKAVAYDGDNYSNVTSATYTIATPITIADARAQVTGDVFTSGIVTSCVGTTAYIEDGNAAICVYGASLTVGDDVNVQGTLTTYHGLLEITNPTVTVLSSGPNVTPATKTIDEINDDYAGDNALQGRLVRIENATVTAISGKNTTIAQGENTIVVRDITGVTLAVNDVVSLTGNIGCYDAAQIVNPTDVEVVQAPQPPSITLSTNAINVTAEGGDGTIDVTYTNFEASLAEVEFFASDGTTSATYDWIVAVVADGKVEYVIEENEGEARTAYFKVYAIDNDANELYSELVTVTQAAPVVDYATLPFEFNGGRADIESTIGLTQSGLDSDYSSAPKLKFNSTGDWVLLKINEVPGDLSFDIKGNSFSGGTFTVQTSVDGETYTDLATYTELGSTQSETFNNLSSDVRYIKWIYTTRSSGNVALGNIKLEKYTTEPQIIVNNTTIDVDANEHDGTLAFSYKNLNITNMEDFDIQYYDANNEEINEPDWIEVLVAEEEGGAGYVVSYFMFANEGEARTAYCKVYAIDDEANLVYSDLITINQAAYVAPSTTVEYELVTDINELEEGQEYIIVGKNNGTYYAMSTTQNNNNRGAVEISVSENIATISSSDVQILTLEEDGEGWNFYTGEGYLYAASNSSNHLKTETAPDDNDNAKATIGISSDGDATIVFQGTNSRNNLRFNNNILFSCYAEESDMPLVQLYKKIEAETAPSVTIGAANWTTYVAETNVSFPSEVTAFTVETIEPERVTLGVVSAVKEGTPILVYSETPGTYTLGVVAESDCADTSSNQLRASEGDVTGNGTTIYALAKPEGKVVGFYPVGNGIPVPAGKAYLEIPPTMSVKGFLALGGVTDAINNIAVETANGTIFNIAGQKVQNITKGGLYIVNGKKVIVK